MSEYLNPKFIHMQMKAKLKALLDQGVDVNEEISAGITHLHIASELGDLELVNLLLKAKANVNAKDHVRGFTPLHLAAAENHIEVLRAFLLVNGIDVNTKDKCHGTPLHFASQNGSLVAVKLLLEKNASINAKNIDCSTPLHLATQHNHLDVTDYLIQNGADVNAKDNVQWTPLHNAVYKGFSLKIVKDLIAKGANINAKGNNGVRPLHIAIEHNHFEIIKFLIESGADITATNKSNCTPLHLAAFPGNIEVIKTLLDKGANINAKTVGNITPLHIAVDFYHLELVELLLQRGADVNAQADDNCTSLHFAAEKGYEHIIVVLLKYNADVNVKATRLVIHLGAHFIHPFFASEIGMNAETDKNCTALFLAAEENHPKIVRLLLQNGAMFDIASTEGSVINFADKTESTDIVTMSQRIKRFFEETKKGNYQIVQELRRMMSSDLDTFLAILNARNSQRQTLIQFAVRNKHKDIANGLTHALQEVKAKKMDEVTKAMSSCDL